MPALSNAAVAEMVKKVGKAVEDARHDEAITRLRVQQIEAWLEAWSKLTLWRRLRWLVTGR